MEKKNRKETMEMLVKAYGDAAMKRTALHKWYSRYENGYESVMGEQRSRHQMSITSQKVQEIKELLDKRPRDNYSQLGLSYNQPTKTDHG